MSPIDFLRLVWPDQGIYCLALRRGSGAPRHWTNMSVEAAAEKAAAEAGRCDVYFCIHTLLAENVPHLTQVNEDGSPKLQTRVQRNMREARCFFLDIDVGAAADKYPSLGEAAAALKKFIDVSGLPTPIIVQSGGGLHLYWPLTDAIPSGDWREHAAKLRHVAIHHGFKIDRSRTTDSASVLRVPGTLNHKTSPAEPVRLLRACEAIPNTRMIQLLDKAVAETGMPYTSPPKLAEAEKAFSADGNIFFEDDSPRPPMLAVLKACEQMRRVAMARGRFSEPVWYHLAIGVGRYTREGDSAAQRLSAGHPEYSEASTAAKIAQNKIAQRGPSSCATVAFHMGEDVCSRCPHRGQVFGPIQAGLREQQAPPPQVVQLLDDVAFTTTISSPPEPFTRTATEGITAKGADADGNPIVEVIYQYDLYPIRRLANVAARTEEQVWHVELPNNEAKDFVLSADALYDLRKFTAEMTNVGIYPDKSKLGRLQEYMTAYINKLQAEMAAESQLTHLGWNEDHTAFIMPDRIIRNDGSVKPAQLSLGAERAAAGIRRSGDVARQIELLRFFNNDAYIPNQFMICCALGSILMHMTGHHGFVMNASGQPGASKSTTLYAGASLYGDPDRYVINGTNTGATTRARHERVAIYANYPVCVDEITHMPVKDAIDLVMGISQPGHRLRLDTSGVERAGPGSHKSTIMLSTANNSLHSVLSLDNAAGTAGSMRVFEMAFEAQRVHQKHQADDFLFGIKDHHGHIGQQFIMDVLARYDWYGQRVREVMRQIDEAAGIRSSERFWSASAVGLVAGEVAFERGWLSYPMDRVRNWLIGRQIPYMRGVVQMEYADPLQTLTGFLESINGNTVIMQKSQHGGNLNVLQTPRGQALYAHYDRGDGMMFVLKKAFKDYCAKIGANATSILNDLNQPRDGSPIVTMTETRRTLGAGTDIAKAQSWCFAINMDHPAVAGAKPTLAVVGGTDTGLNQGSAL